jgi:two-component SAPR family response regulator
MISEMPRRVIIIDDDSASLLLYKRNFRNADSIQVVGEFERAEDALLQIPLLKPDVAITDYSLPGISGFDFAKQTQVQYPGIKILLVTCHDPEFLNSTLIAPVPNISIVQKTWSKNDMNRIINLCNS